MHFKQLYYSSISCSNPFLVIYLLYNSFFTRLQTINPSKYLVASTIHISDNIYNSYKLLPCSAQCISIGCNTSNQWYICLQPFSGRVCITRHIVFDESIFPYSYLSSNQSSSLPLPVVSPFFFTSSNSPSHSYNHFIKFLS